MADRVLISGAFGDAQYQFGFFELIAKAMEQQGITVERFNAFSFNAALIGHHKTLERFVTLPGRMLGIDKQRIRAALPWTPDGQRERALLAAVRRFRPDTLVVITGFRYRAATLFRCRALGVRRLVGWYVEGPLAAGVPEAESLLYDRYFCIHRELDASSLDRIGWLPSYGLDAANFMRLRFPRRPLSRIAFVGTPTERRVRFLDALRALPLDIWGPKWGKVASLRGFHRGEFIWGAALNQLYNDSAIVLNIASWDSALSGMTQRIAEIPASGAFLLTDDSSEVLSLLVPGREMQVFSSPEQLYSHCRYYLGQHAEREAIADRGHRRVQQWHDYGLAARVLAGRVPAPTMPTMTLAN